MKEYLSDIKTMAELVEYLAVKTLDHSMRSANQLKNFMVNFGTLVCQMHYSPMVEEADTLLLLHALSVNGNVEITID